MADEKDKYATNIYDHLKAYDILTILKPLLDGNFYLRPEDGKLKANRIAISKDTPWIHVKHTVGLDCGLWHQITFNAVIPNLPEDQKFVPRHCQSCWKVVIKPRTLQQLFNLLEMQKALGRPSKCGIEIRETVYGLYGGYFYNKSFQAGLECYDVVKAAMLKNEYLSPLIDEVDEHGRTIRIILKRACTEYEHLIGDSSKWQVTEEQNFIEDLIDNYIVGEQLSLRQPDHVIWNIKRRWIEWAWKNGDPTYARYTGGKPLYPAYVTYHQPEMLENKKGEETMTMRVAFLKDYKKFKAMDEVYIPRPLGRNLCQQKITVPWSIKDSNSEYKKLKKQIKPKPKKKPRKRAVSKKAETRERAIKQ